MKQCFGYVRVSTVKQGDGVSLAAQREAIEAFASRHNIEIVKWFEEKETAAKRGRPLFNLMVKQLQRGKAHGLVIHKIDRSARNFADWAKIGDLQDAGIDIHFATESLDFSSRGGRLTADIQAVIAADYIRNLREETIKGLNGRLKQGLYPFRAPIGYLDNGRGKAKTPDPVRAPLVVTAFELYASRRHSLRTLLAEMHRRGLTGYNGRLISLHGLENILNNPFYAGLIQIKRSGMTYRGVHERLISPSLFERVHPFRVVIVCAMWLTGFDVPSLSTLYLDKPLQAHTLMQAIARANRVKDGKNNGLIVDYCGILKNLRKALATFAGHTGDACLITFKQRGCDRSANPTTAA